MLLKHLQMKIKYLLPLLITFLFIGYSCTSVKVVHKSQLDEIKDNSIYYSLPKTVLKVNVELTRSITVPGPFNRYADKYLGITNAIKTKNEEWSISNIEILSYPVPDNKNIYYIQSNKNSIAENIVLSNDGLLLAINKDIVVENQEFNTNSFLVFGEESISFTEQSVKKNLIERVDTTFKTIETDTAVSRIQVLKKFVEGKTQEENAEEAANFIIRLRKRRFKLLAGMNAKNTSGGALDIMIKELNKTEKEYIALFTGKTVTEKYNSSYEYSPTVNTTDGYNLELFQFSKQKGIVEKGDNVILTVNNYGIDKINSYNVLENKDKEIENGIVYRTPERAEIKVSINNKTLASKKLLIAQFGSLNALPSRILKCTNKQIEFYKDYGSIKSIKEQ